VKLSILDLILSAETAWQLEVGHRASWTSRSPVGAMSQRVESNEALANIQTEDSSIGKS